MAFHAKDGWYFTRHDDGSVHIDYIDGDTLTATITFDPNTWASIVASVSAQGENAHTFWTATRFHGAAA